MLGQMLQDLWDPQTEASLRTHRARRMRGRAFEAVGYTSLTEAAWQRLFQASLSSVLYSS
jgi:hypothetical protein